MPRTSLSRVELEYLEEGPADGPLAVCLHGFPDGANTFDSLRAELAANGYRAVAPWLPGYLPSGFATNANYQIGAVAADIAEFIAELAGDRTDTVLIGHDWGSLIGHGVAASIPERLRSFVAMAVPHQASLVESFLNSPDQLQRSWYIFVFQSPLAETAVAANDFAFIDKLWREWSPSHTPPSGHLRAIKDGFAHPEALNAALGYYRHMLGTIPASAEYADLDAAAFGLIHVPTLYLHGEDDGCMGIDLVSAAALEPLYPAGLRIARVADAGHFLHLDAPRAVNDLVLDFLGARNA